MFIINDIELLVRLGKHKLLQGMLTRCAMAISALKLSQYSFSVQKEFEAYAKVPIMDCDGEFMQWYYGKGGIASIGDLSSMFVAQQSSGTLVLSHEENPLLQWQPDIVLHIWDLMILYFKMQRMIA
jgi:hypothetical protein